MKVNIITLFPELIRKHFEYLPFKKALELGILDVNIVNLRDFGLDSYGSVDEKPYGGGIGMLLRVEPIYNAIGAITSNNKPFTILLSPKGKKYDQQLAKTYSDKEEITLICGRYEGVDARVEKYVDEIVSVGDYVLSGGEFPALVIIESITRLLPGILDEEATALESFSNGQLEFPQYTRPEEFKGDKVPEVLLSGNHKKIAEWRKNNSIPVE